MKHFVWKNGSARMQSTKKDIVQQVQKKEQLQKEEQQEQAINTALNTISDPLQGFSECASKREDVNSKIGERALVGRVSYNPFLTDNTYVHDIAIEDSLLRPKNSSI